MYTFFHYRTMFIGRIEYILFKFIFLRFHSHARFIVTLNLFVSNIFHTCNDLVSFRCNEYEYEQNKTKQNKSNQIRRNSSERWAELRAMDMNLKRITISIYWCFRVIIAYDIFKSPSLVQRRRYRCFLQSTLTIQFRKTIHWL